MFTRTRVLPLAMLRASSSNLHCGYHYAVIIGITLWMLRMQNGTATRNHRNTRYALHATRAAHALLRRGQHTRAHRAIRGEQLGGNADDLPLVPLFAYGTMKIFFVGTRGGLACAMRSRVSAAQAAFCLKRA